MFFDIDSELVSLSNEIGLKVEDTGGKIEFLGEDPIAASVHHIGAMGAVPTMLGGVAAATIWRHRTGEGQDLSVDLREAIFAVGDPGFGIKAFRATINGYPYPVDGDSPHPIRAVTEFHEMKDGRWGSLNAHYRHMLFSWLSLLKCAPDPQSVTDAVRKWNSADLEEAALEKKVCFSLVRSEEEWAECEQGKLQHNTPVVEITKIAESEPEPFKPARRPLEGVRVLSCAHAIAGPIVGRTLALHGAEVLDMQSPRQIEQENVRDESNVGLRSAFLDLKSPDGIQRARELVAKADIFVENLRGGALDRLGLMHEELAKIRPGIIIVTVRAYGYFGPWFDRPGNDRQGTAASGLAVAEGIFEHPRLPPCRTTNDFVTGYFGAAGAMAALIRRAKEGGSYHINVSLVRSAMWSHSLGLIDRSLAEDESWPSRMIKPRSIIRETPLGQLHRLATPLVMSATTPDWVDPILVPRGSARPEWLSAD